MGNSVQSPIEYAANYDWCVSELVKLFRKNPDAFYFSWEKIIRLRLVKRGTRYLTEAQRRLAIARAKKIFNGEA